MVDISVYRHRIGTFRQLTRDKSRKKCSSTKIIMSPNSLTSLIIRCIFACLAVFSLKDLCLIRFERFSVISFYHEAEVVVFVFILRMVGNFFARYIHGNIIKNDKGTYTF